MHNASLAGGRQPVSVGPPNNTARAPIYRMSSQDLAGSLNAVSYGLRIPSQTQRFTAETLPESKQFDLLLPAGFDDTLVHPRPMAACIYCGTETKLYVNGVPMCAACSKDLDEGNKPPYHRDLPPSKAKVQAAGEN